MFQSPSDALLTVRYIVFVVAVIVLAFTLHGAGVTVVLLAVCQVSSSAVRAQQPTSRTSPRELPPDPASEGGEVALTKKR